MFKTKLMICLNHSKQQIKHNKEIMSGGHLAKDDGISLCKTLKESGDCCEGSVKIVLWDWGVGLWGSL